MIRSLTPEEKALSQTARKQANKILQDERRKAEKEYRAAVKAKAGETYMERLLRQVRAINEVKGSPVTVRISSQEIVIDYDLLRGMLRRLKNRYINSIKISAGLLTIVHSVPFHRSCGEVVLYQIPDYQRMHLTNIPEIDIEVD
jgi:hypothetical protein